MPALPRLLADLNLLGLLFESLVVRDLRVYAQGLDGQVRHYRDSNGFEVDAIVWTGAGQRPPSRSSSVRRPSRPAPHYCGSFADGIDTVSVARLQP
jgi:hypothetical protein